MINYTYIYYDDKMLPYYVGQGSRYRYVDHHRVPVPPKSRIIVQRWDSQDEAYRMEKWWIALFGRMDIGTGTLLNLTDGGPGVSNPNDGVRERMREAGYIQGPKTVANMRAHQTAESLARGGRVAGLLSAGKPKNISEEGRRRLIENGRIAGQRAVSKGGHLSGDRGFQIRSRAGRKNVESGLLESIASEAGKKGSHVTNHIRWHINRGIKKPDCELCQGC